MREAYASASSDKILIDTLSFWFEGMEPSPGASELYLFNGDNPTVVDDNGVPLLNARIEASSLRDAGRIVTFIGIPFSITLPAISVDTVVSAQLTVDSVNREGHDLLEAAAKGGKPIEVTFRTYILRSELDGPSNDPPLRFRFAGASADNNSVTGRLEFLAIGNVPFPRDIYRPERFPTLSYA